MARPFAADFNAKLRVFNQNLTSGEIQSQLAQFARAKLTELQDNGQAPAHYERYVNGRHGAAEESVILPGPIVYEFSWLPEILIYAKTFAIRISPEDSGDYKRAWAVLMNGGLIEDYSAIPPDAEVVLVNYVPYARKVDVGAMRMRVPPGIIEATRQAVMRRFGNVVTAERKFINLHGNISSKWEVPYILQKGSQRRGRADKDRKKGTELTYPCLVMRMRFT